MQSKPHDFSVWFRFYFTQAALPPRRRKRQKGLVMQKTKTHSLVLAAMMVALSFVLSCAKLQEMPMGGSIVSVG